MSDIAADAREAAYSFEAKKHRLTHGQDGYLFTMLLHPHEVPDGLMRAKLGSRWMCSMVLIGHDELPVKSRQRTDGERAVQSAAVLSKDPKFQAWLTARGMADHATEIGAAEGLRLYLGVDSRSELREDERARLKFDALKMEFEHGRR